MNSKSLTFNRSEKTKWIAIAFIIKLLMFFFFAYNFSQNWPKKDLIGTFFVVTGDTWGYYIPVENLVAGDGYSSVCRMPGLLPIYAPLNYFFGAVAGKVTVVFLQVLADAFATYALAMIAFFIFKNRKLFFLTFFLYSFSSFVSVWNHCGMSESFSTAFLISSIYFLLRPTSSNSTNKYALIAAIFLTWAVFFRPVLLLAFICIPFVIYFRTPHLKAFNRLGTIAVFISPLALSLLLWNTYNNLHHNKNVWLQANFEECYPGVLSVEHLAIRDFVITVGGDYQPWSKNSEAEFFFTENRNEAFKSHKFPLEYNLDSLNILRQNYLDLGSELKTDFEKNILKAQIKEKSKRYSEAYKNAWPVNYHFLNRIKIICKLIFPQRLDDLPFPKKENMNLVQFAIKGGYLVLLNLVSALGLLGMLLSFKSTWYISLFPIMYCIAIGGILGFLEQRYLVSIYPFFCLFAAKSLSLSMARIFSILKP